MSGEFLKAARREVNRLRGAADSLEEQTAESITNTVMQRVAIELAHQGIPAGFNRAYRGLRAQVFTLVKTQIA